MLVLEAKLEGLKEQYEKLDEAIQTSSRSRIVSNSAKLSPFAFFAAKSFSVISGIDMVITNKKHQ